MFWDRFIKNSYYRAEKLVHCINALPEIIYSSGSKKADEKVIFFSAESKNVQCFCECRWR